MHLLASGGGFNGNVPERRRQAVQEALAMEENERGAKRRQKKIDLEPTGIGANFAPQQFLATLDEQVAMDEVVATFASDTAEISRDCSPLRSERSPSQPQPRLRTLHEHLATVDILFRHYEHQDQEQKFRSKNTGLFIPNLFPSAHVVHYCTGVMEKIRAVFREVSE
jgi:hypothetical protein